MTGGVTGFRPSCPLAGDVRPGGGRSLTFGGGRPAAVRPKLRRTQRYCKRRRARAGYVSRRLVALDSLSVRVRRIQRRRREPAEQERDHLVALGLGPHARPFQLPKDSMTTACE